MYCVVIQFGLLHFTFCSSKSALKDSARARIPKVAELRNGELLPAMIQRPVLLQENERFLGATTEPLLLYTSRFTHSLTSVNQVSVYCFVFQCQHTMLME